MMACPIVRWRPVRGREFRRAFGNRFAIAGVLLGLAGCAGSVPPARDLLAAPGFTRATVAVGEFDLLTLNRGTPEKDATLTIYIEGDGHAFRHRNRPAADPTPRHPVGLALASRDPGEHVLYVARPCQFQARPLPPACHPALWTTARYGEAAVTAINAAIDEAAAGYGRVALVGYSGGGTVAALVAARRTDVAWIITVAANLDHTRWTALHGVTALTGSLNAADVARSVQHIPQVHYVGGRDDIVPPATVTAYADRMTDTTHTAIRVMPDFDHACCWVEAWPRLLEEARTPSAPWP